MPAAEIFILGEKLAIKGDVPVERIREMSTYIDSRIKEVTDKYPNIPPNKALILTMFNITEELFKQKQEQEDIAKDICEKTNILAELFE